MRRRGVTLVEMLIVVSLVGLLVAITYPAVSAGIDSLRIRSASDSIAGFLNAALNLAERRQEAIEVEISPAERTLRMRSPDPGFLRTLELPDGIEVRKVLPELPEETGSPRRFLLYPGGTVPRIGVELENRRGVRRTVRVDPITGVPQVEAPEAR
jgi:prepilin-type N-terminal cleavage/methylation domain-containing protein